MTLLSLLGMGQRGKRMCHIFKLLKGGSFNVTSPPKSKKPKKSRNLNKCDPNRFHHLQSNKETISSPIYTIACLVGKANEAHILIDDVECLTLVDLGAQIYTITIELIKQLGLKIHQLDRIIKF